MASVDDVIRKFWRDIREQLAGDRTKAAAQRAANQLKQPRRAADAKSAMPAQQQRLPIRKERHVHVGVDYGTSWSKLVFRDYQREGEPRSYVVRHTSALAQKDFRCPSTVVLHNDRLYFGWAAEDLAQASGARAFRSLKVRLAFPRDFQGEPTPLPQGFTVDDLIVLYLVHLLQAARGPATAYCDRLRSVPRFTMTLGVPVTDLDNPVLRSTFVRLARLAYYTFTEQLVETENGIRLEDARAAVDLANAYVNGTAEATPESWIRAEFQAALLWPIQSPDVPAGLYGAIDVGGGTTNSSLFQIVETFDDDQKCWIKNGVAFYGAACAQSGADKLDRLLADTAGAADFSAIRGTENQIIAKLPDSTRPVLDRMLNEYFDGYKTSFHRAYSRYQRQGFWTYKVFLLGGGTEVDAVKQKLARKPWPNMINVPEMISCSAPADLFEIGDKPVRVSDLKFLLVAYGLSFLNADVPPAATPDQIPPFRPNAGREMIMDLDECYPK